jgi:two-component system sensor histidine kinase DesK
MRQDEKVTERSEGRLAGIRGGLRDLLAVPPSATDPPPRPAIEAPAEPGHLDGGSDRAGDAVDLARCGPEEIRKRRLSGRHRWYGGSSVGLIYLAIAMGQAATSGGSVGSIVLFEVLAVCFAAVYVLAPMRVAGGSAFAAVGGGTAARLGVLLLMLAITIGMMAVGGVGVTGFWIYIGVVAAILFRLPVALAIAVVLAAAMLIVWGVAGEGLPWELAVTLVALSLWMAGFAGNIRLTVELRATREELARAAVAAERDRIGRDLHDILGHSLTAIAVKAGLARRLAPRDADQAAAEIADVERLAREALADVRATAAGYRDVSLATELAVARSVLEAAGIRAEIPTAVDDVSPAGRGVFGFVVREAVTNVVRHAAATRCIIELSPVSIEIRDDGTGAGAAASRGSGLRGLAERLVAVGGTLTAGALPGGGFRVRADVAARASGAAG